MPPIEKIVPLETSHIPFVMRLNEAAGWNQTEKDWARVISVEPEGCFALFADGVLASTATAVCFGRALAWIGMVLTDPAFRGRGYARRLMEHALEFLDRRGMEWIKLDATDMGRPLYLRLGFEDEAPVERWVLDNVPAMPRVDLPPYEPDPALDFEAFGACRSRMLELLSAEGAASIPGEGFAMARAGAKADYFGPCVCRSPQAARRFLEWFLSRSPGRSAAWDILPTNVEAVRLAREFGFERRRQLVRQVRPGPAAGQPLPHNDAYVFAIAAFEYG
ncbi:MAG TPA: GNAT family N-acetyltransferase [Bryobacteraceae bacterium]|nr:GNAT family N-acetyltransferase [Bryobacteraceae bacterium]